MIVLLSSCYKDEHFTIPGPYSDEEWGQDTMPFPFSTGKSVGIYLIKDGEVDFKRVVTRGFTDFVPEIGTDQYSWYQGTDRHGKKFFGSRQHKNFYQLSDQDNFGGNKFSYECNDLYAKPFLQTGKGKNWYFYARMSLGSLGYNTKCDFVFEGEEWSKRAIAGFDRQYTKYTNVAACPQFYFYRKGVLTPVRDDKYAPCYLFTEPGEPFEYELVCVDRFVYCRVNGTTIWTQELDSGDHARPMMFRPWTNSANFYDVYIEGDFQEMDVVAHQHEAGYTTIQAPALAKSGNDVLLFAEGRKENMRQEAVRDSKRSNATDIVMKRTADGGETWSELAVIAGGGGTVNMRPCLITGTDGVLYLFYTVDRTGKQTGNYTVYMQKSTDGGKQWSAPMEIPCSITGYTVLTMAGHGIQMSNGVLVVPLHCYYGKTATIATMYSDDGGTTWKAGTPLNGYRNQYANLIEINGKLVMYIGHNGSGNSRKLSYSNDSGMNWTEPVFATINTGKEGYVSPGATVKTADGKIIHFSANGFVAGSNYSLASVGASINADLDQRKEMYIYRSPDFSSGLTLQVSSDNGTTWSTPESMLTVQTYKNFKFMTGNTDAIMVNNNTVMCVCEGGVSVPYEGLLVFKKAL